jgi:glycosyltransferase involved in cell wall biosynthesis
MLLSVITINLNNLSGLKKTVASIMSQAYTDFEYIIIDGASTDGSAEYVKELKSDGKNLKILSEPDRGIYHAMNKGLVLAKGEYVHFLNSGDYLVDNNVYGKVFRKSLSKADVIYGNRMDVYPDGQKVLNKGLQKSGLTFGDAYRGCIPHSSTFTKRSLFEKFGKFNESYKIVSDTEFYLRTIGLGGCTSKYIDLTISCFDMSGISKNQDTQALQQSEFEAMKKKVLSPELVSTYEFSEKYGYKMQRINRRRWSFFLFRVLNHLAYLINGK